MPDSTLTAKKILDEYKTLLTQRSTSDTEWQRIAEVLLPQASAITVRRTEGSSKTQELFDATGPDAYDKMVSAVIGTLTSPVIQWFRLTERRPELNAIPEIAFWLEDTSSRMMQAIQNSNWKTEGHFAMRDLIGFGTNYIMTIEAEPEFSKVRNGDFRGLRFQASPIGTYVIKENGFGRIDGSIRSFMLSAEAIVRRWPLAEYNPEFLRQADTKPFEPIPILHDVRVMPGMERWESTYMLEAQNEKDSTFLSNSRFMEYPIINARYDKATGEIYGFGRGHMALPEVKTLNRARQFKLRQWALAVNPPLQAIDDAVFGKPRLVPGAINRVRVDGAISAIDVGMRFDHTAIPEQDSKLQIRQIFFTEQLLQFAPIAKTPPTATEVIQQLEFLYQLLGPALGRIQDEWLSPMIERIFSIMLRANAFLPPPDIFLELGGIIDIEYEGPLARAQRTDELRAMSDTIQFAGALAGADQNVFDNFDIDEMARDLTRITGSSRRYLRPIAAVEQRRQQRAEQQQALMRQQALVEGAGAAKDAGQASQAFAQSQVPGQDGPV